MQWMVSQGSLNSHAVGNFVANPSTKLPYCLIMPIWSKSPVGSGPLIVEDESDPAVDHDLVLMIDDWLLADDGTIDEASFGSLHDWAHGGRLGNWLTVNGESHPILEVAKNSRIRIRLINAANARIFGLNIPTTAFLIAEDGYPVPVQPTQDVVLAPAQRADFIVDLGTEDVTIFETERQYPAVTLKAVDSDKALVSKRRSASHNSRHHRQRLTYRSHSICKVGRW